METLSEIAREAILWTLSQHNWHRSRTAHTLGISVRCLRNKIHEYKDDGWLIPESPDKRILIIPKPLKLKRQFSSEQLIQKDIMDRRYPNTGGSWPPRDKSIVI